jgi:hypothetical protein
MTQPNQARRRWGPLTIALLVVVLLALHQDYWFWTDATLVLGVLPIGLFWHVCHSIAAGLMWYLATRIAWPLDETVAEPTSGAAQPDVSEGRHR